MSICCKPRSRGNRIRYHPDSVKSYRLSSRLQPISAGRRSTWNALHLAIFYFLNHHRTESDSRKFLKFPPKRVYEYCRMVKIKEERERSTIDIGTRIYHSERVEVSRVVETSLDYTEDVYWNGANVRDSQSLPARRCDDHYDHGPRAMPTAVRDNETSAKAARSFCHLYPLRDRNIITPSLPSFLSSLHAVPPGRTDSRLSIFILSCSWKPVARPSIERAGGAVN